MSSDEESTAESASESEAEIETPKSKKQPKAKSKTPAKKSARLSLQSLDKRLQDLEKENRALKRKLGSPSTFSELLAKERQTLEKEMEKWQTKEKKFLESREVLSARRGEQKATAEKRAQIEAQLAKINETYLVLEPDKIPEVVRYKEDLEKSLEELDPEQDYEEELEKLTPLLAEAQEKVAFYEAKLSNFTKLEALL